MNTQKKFANMIKNLKYWRYSYYFGVNQPINRNKTIIIFKRINNMHKTAINESLIAIKQLKLTEKATLKTLDNKKGLY